VLPPHTEGAVRGSGLMSAKALLPPPVLMGPDLELLSRDLDWVNAGTVLLDLRRRDRALQN
jgi:hypothetical protein